MYPRYFSTILIVLDVLFVFEVWWAQRIFEHGFWGNNALILVPLLLSLLISTLYALDTYLLTDQDRTWQRLPLVALACIIFHVIQPFLFRLFDLTFSLAGVAFSLLIGILYLSVTRVFLSWGQAKASYPRRTLVVGEGEELDWAYQFFNHRSDFEVIGFLSFQQKNEKFDLWSPLRLEQSIQILISLHKIEWVCLSSRNQLPPALETELLRLKLRGLKIFSYSDMCQQFADYIPLEYVNERWLLFSDGFVFNSSPIRRHIKRIFDLGLSALGFLILSFVAILVWFLNSRYNPGPLFYSQMRVGLNGREFRIYKFRTMIPKAEHEEGPSWASVKDHRASAWGQWMRKVHLDELPQLWNVLKGNMSLVGPRPERREMIAEMEKELPYYELRHFVKPGITGWAQVKMRYADSLVTTRQKLQYDLFYMRNLSLLLDLIILAKTIRHILFGQGR
ncbi:exopolysaccharide biosynthesis polyprenyl glycosylphosphotransferase [Deltaproteobacteria bacterium TL4]